ncbi:MAG: ArsA-related P-loop ATPase [Candidatus Omnitrophota bacterium]
MIKVAFSGKGGVGKTTLGALFIRALSKDARMVLAVDCDPVSNLGRSLGIEDADAIIPLAEMKELIRERMEVSPDRTLYKLNPTVDDIPDKFARQKGNIKLIVMGTVRMGGAGCMCPESGFLKALLSKLLLGENESMVMDMEAGVEHLGRATAGFIDNLFIVVEPSTSSIEAAKKIARLAGDLKIKDISVILNKIRNANEINFIGEKIYPLSIIGSIPFDEKFLEMGMDKDIEVEKTEVYKAIVAIKDKLLKERVHS